MNYIKNNLIQLRAQFPALSQKYRGKTPIYFDGPGGSQLPKSVIDAMSEYLWMGNSNMGGYNGAGQNTMHINNMARSLASMWLGANQEEIIFGLNSTSLMFQMSRVLSRNWQAGDVVILSDIDHYSHVSSWEQAAKDKGVIVKKIPLNQTIDDLEYDTLDDLICSRTRLVAVSLASNVVGTVVDVAKVIAKAKQVGALVSVDAVHGAVHLPIDVHGLGVDLLFTSAYKIGGGHLGVMYAKDELLKSMTPYKVEPATDIAPMAYEQGTQSFEAQAGFAALMHYWAGLSGNKSVDKANFNHAYQEILAYEQELGAYALRKFAERDYLKMYGKNQVMGRTPTFAFNVIKKGQMMDGLLISQKMGEHNIALGYGNFYAKALCEHLSPTGMVLRMGCMHYSSVEEVDQFFDVLDEMVGG